MRISVAVFCLIPLSLAFGQRKISLFTAIDVGRLESGYDMPKKYDASGLAMNRTYVNVGFSEQLDERYMLSVGVGGIFWKAFEGQGGNPEDKVIKFGPGISQAFMKWTPMERLGLTFGYFPYKYNNAAKNLGEYLFRTEAYPTIVYTGGWSWINDAQYKAVGAKLTHESPEGAFRQDLGLFGEYFNAPIYDLTPAYIATWNMKFFTLGGAASMHRFITPTPKTKKVLKKTYEYHENFFLPEVAAQPGVEARPAQYVTMLRNDILEKASEDGSDSATYFGHVNNAGNPIRTVSFDNAATKLVAFFDLNLNAMTGLDRDRMGAFNIYGEVAQLGLKDYPIFYTEKSQRRPMMLGFSIPTFGILNHISFEVEYLKNANIESIASTYDKLDLPPDAEYRYQTYSKDDYKWTVHASRGFAKHLSLYVQVANDHMRLKDGFARPEYIPVTHEPSHWYWLTRIQWMI